MWQVLGFLLCVIMGAGIARLPTEYFWPVIGGLTGLIIICLLAIKGVV